MKNFKNIFKIIHKTYLDLRFLVWYIFLNEFVFDFYLLEGESMQPTFKSYGDIVFVDKLSKHSTTDFKKGDIVSVINPINSDMKMCKRIVYKEGDKITFKNGNEIIVPKNHVWVEGDNKDNSLDSRKFGPISKHLIVGKIRMQVWPAIKFFH